MSSSAVKGTPNIDVDECSNCKLVKDGEVTTKLCAISFMKFMNARSSSGSKTPLDESIRSISIPVSDAPSLSISLGAKKSFNIIVSSEIEGFHSGIVVALTSEWKNLEPSRSTSADAIVATTNVDELQKIYKAFSKRLSQNATFRSRCLVIHQPNLANASLVSVISNLASKSPKFNLTIILATSNACKLPKEMFQNTDMIFAMSSISADETKSTIMSLASSLCTSIDTVAFSSGAKDVSEKVSEFVSSTNVPESFGLLTPEFGRSSVGIIFGSVELMPPNSSDTSSMFRFVSVNPNEHTDLKLVS